MGCAGKLAGAKRARWPGNTGRAAGNSHAPRSAPPSRGEVPSKCGQTPQDWGAKPSSPASQSKLQLRWKRTAHLEACKQLIEDWTKDHRVANMPRFSACPCG